MHSLFGDAAVVREEHATHPSRLRRGQSCRRSRGGAAPVAGTWRIFPFERLPLLPQQQTFLSPVVMSEKCHKQIWLLAQGRGGGHKAEVADIESATSIFFTE